LPELDSFGDESEITNQLTMQDEEIINKSFELNSKDDLDQQDAQQQQSDDENPL
jgi:hypothetical protein